MKPIASQLALLVTSACLLIACGDKELEAKRDRLALEIKRLEAELAVARSQLDEPLPDHTQDLAVAREELANAKADIVQLEQDVADLAARKKDLEQQFDAYRRKYRIGSGSN